MFDYVVQVESTYFVIFCRADHRRFDIQQRGRNSVANDGTATDLKQLLEANLVLSLSEVYATLFAQTKTVGPSLEPVLVNLFKIMLCVLEEYAPGRMNGF